ncbi:5-oxoprolinase subunit PxpB [Motilimonas eburnea]|uniref:5-oxoprolinase subunit PxpB n=1 Tax=Motilimonas eburnea TaxID=1737488 RepID=UPI001E4539E9|nr:5-oxoprolinase subunit PxpB [Motilimonas eburnea]MCE2570157.1 5-oxoprolinase subunit PxpB [Motilimonas eburnea]
MLAIHPLNETSLLVTFGDQFDNATLDLIGLFCHQLKSRCPARLLKEVLPSYNTVMIEYHIDRISFDQLHQLIHQSYLSIVQLSPSQSETRLVELPVFYMGPDLARIANHANMSVEQVIQCHSDTLYRVYAIGFSPGFPYLGEVDPRIATPRLTSPRKQVAAGSVGIADNQTGIYPNASPGGWNILGLCPHALLDNDYQCRLQVGDQVRFVPIAQDEFLHLGGQLGEEFR